MFVTVERKKRRTLKLPDWKIKLNEARRVAPEVITYIAFAIEIFVIIPLLILTINR